MTQTEESQAIKIFVPVTKIDEELHIVFGWGNVESVNGELIVDLQGDYFESIEVLEKAVYDFMAVSQTHDEMHERIVETSKIVESFMVTDEKLAKMFPGIDPSTIAGPRGWWLGVQINDEEVFKLHKEGVYKGFSITGKALKEVA